MQIFIVFFEEIYLYILIFCSTFAPAMEDSSFIISPLSADFSDVWSEPQVLSSGTPNVLYTAVRFGRRFVLKALALEYRDSTPHIELLRKEFSIGVGLDHPNIVRLLDFGQMDSIGWYIQMEYIDGLTLEQYLATHPSVKDRRRILNQLIDALSFLHERQIIHRDVKPANILITRNGSTLKLIDFGVSDTDDYVTFKQPAGSLAYIAPEQLAGLAIDNRADIFAMGRIIQLVFPHRYIFIARRCTRLKPERRYSSCARIARAIRRTDRLRIGVPIALLLFLAVGFSTWLFLQQRNTIDRQRIEQIEVISSHIDSIRRQDEVRQNVIDSMRAQNAERQIAVDTLNRVVESLVVKVYSPTPKEINREKVNRLFEDYFTATRRAVNAGDLASILDKHPTPREKFMEEYHMLYSSIKDVELQNDFDEYAHHYYHSKYASFVQEIRDQLPPLVRSDSDYFNIGIGPW